MALLVLEENLGKDLGRKSQKRRGQGEQKNKEQVPT